MGISDFRYNAFNNAMELINITDEVHVVPSNAPYQIRLSEVPSKDNPSTVSVRYYDDDVNFVEVGAPPSKGQFWCDYNTENADWNTGTIRFNAEDAGKRIKVSYRGIGTLASIKSPKLPSWWHERGDGSLGDKICSNGEVFCGVYNYKSFTVPVGVTVYVDKTARILCQSVFINNGAINGVGRAVSSVGFCAGQGGKGGNSPLNIDVDPIGRNGENVYENYILAYGGSASWRIISNVMQHNQYDICCGSRGGIGGDNFQSRGGGVGGMGGAGFFILAQSIINTGTIVMQGAQGAGTGGYNDGGGGGGGGGGGVVVCIASAISNKGAINVDGGSGGAPSGRANWGNAGSVGWIKLLDLGVLL